MPLSKVNRPGLNTGVTDNSDATAITIDSSERVGLGTSTPNFSQQIVYGTSGGLAVASNAIPADDTTGLIANAKSNTSSDFAFKAGSYNDGYRLLVRADGMVTTPQQPTYHGYFNAVFGANSSLGTRITAHITTVQNVGNIFNSSNHRWTVPVAGQYLFHVTVMKSGNNVAAGHLDISFNGQGANTTYRLRMSEGATYDQASLTVIRNLSANDYMELYYYGTPNIHSNHSSIVVRLLG